MQRTRAMASPRAAVVARRSRDAVGDAGDAPDAAHAPAFTSVRTASQALLRVALVVALVAAMAPAANAGTEPGEPVVVRELNETYGSDSQIWTDNSGTGPTQPSFAELNGAWFFAATDEVAGNELWKSDGTPEGTVRVRDIWPGPNPSRITRLFAWRGAVYFFADDGSQGLASWAIWRSDGTADGTAPLARVTSPLSSPGFFDGGDRLYLTGYDGSRGSELWCTDGTPGGTRMVKHVESGSVSLLAALGDVALFVARDGTSPDRVLWRTDGTSAVRVDVDPVVSFSGSRALAVLDGRAIVAATHPAHGQELWVTDGTRVEMLEDIREGPLGSITSLASGIDAPVVGDRLCFRATQNGSTWDLWSTDGTPDGTARVATFGSRSVGSFAPAPCADGARLFTVGEQLWKTDGTALGTILVHGDLTWMGAWMGAAAGTTYFPRTLGLVRELWKSDGTASGTVAVRDIGGVTLINQPTGAAGSKLFFLASDGPTGGELWRTDGTTAGTGMVRDIAPGGGLAGSSNRRLIGAVGDAMLFVADDGVISAELWRSDGTEAGTVLVKDVNPSAYASSITVGGVVGSTVYFGGVDGPGGTNAAKLWKSDGTAAGTVRVRDVRPETFAGFHEYGGTAYFSGYEPTAGQELWRTDGTEAGTVRVANIAAGTASSAPSDLVPAGGHLYFAAHSGSLTRRLWRTDGTPEGTLQVVEAGSGALVEVPAIGQSSAFGPWSAEFANTLYFRGRLPSGYGLFRVDAAGGAVLVKAIYAEFVTSNGPALFFRASWQLWKSDGTEAGTQVVAPGAFDTLGNSIVALAGAVYFPAYDATRGWRLWRSDGTPAGTNVVTDDATTFAASQVAAAGSRVYFVANDGSGGYALWRTDGTAAGTTLVKDGFTVPLTQFRAFGSGVCFYADDGATGTELWWSDGTLDGTRVVKDIWPGGGVPSSLQAPVLGVVGDTLYFAANDYTHGNELWKVSLVPDDDDGDGLLNRWERRGYTHPSGRFVDLPAEGARPDRKDVFVEVDWMGPGDGCPGHRPAAAEMQSVLDAFAARDITLHILLGDEVEHAAETGLLWNGIYDWLDFDVVREASFAEERELSFHYCLFAHRLGGSNRTGISRGIPEADFIVALGSLPDQTGTPIQQWGTFMHELGHNLGLFHGGQDNAPWKPNYLSVMNYHFQTTGLVKDLLPGALDYSFAALPALDETRLDETVGLNGGPAIDRYGTRWWFDPPPYTEGNGKNARQVDPAPELRETLAANGPIDWDDSGGATSTDTQADVNVGRDPAPRVLTLLRGYEDWPFLKFTGGSVGHGAPVPPPQVTDDLDEMDTDTVLLLAAAPPPRDLRAHVTDAAQIALTWVPVAPRPQQRYRVYRWEAGADPALLAETANSEFQDTTAVSGTTYSYKVIALGANDVEGSGSRSVTVTAR